MPFICKRCGKEAGSLVSGEHTRHTEWTMVCDDCYTELSGIKDVPNLLIKVYGGSKWPIEDVAKCMRVSKEEAQAMRDKDDGI